MSILAIEINAQILPTVPKNVFRITYGNYSSQDMWDSETQNFDFKNIGRAYFDNEVKGDGGVFSSPFDLYHKGSINLDTVQTIESWMNWFNNQKGTNLPVFEAGFIDTSSSVYVGGTFKESLKREKAYDSYKIEYGLTNKITISVDLSLVSRYTVDQSILELNSYPINGVNDLISYHKNAKLELENFRNSDTYFYMSDSLKYKIDRVYDTLYTENSPHSVLWVFNIGDDPLNNGFVGDRFIPYLRWFNEVGIEGTPINEIGKDTVKLSDLINYYYPSQKSSSGLDDTRIGIKMLLAGAPAWSMSKNKSALYGIVRLLIPSGYTIRSFKDVRQKQFSKENIGIGVKRYSLGLQGDYFFRDRRNFRIFGKILFSASTPERLYTPINILAANHTNPDSIITIIGETYKYTEGSSVFNEFGIGFDPKPNRFRLKITLKNIHKKRDQFLSNDRHWDSWKESHDGYDTSYKKRDIKMEAYFINNHSDNRFGPLPFECFLGLRTNLSSTNTFYGSLMYFGLIFNLQGW